MDEEDLDLRMIIKQLLSKNAQFRNPTFDPAPYLIQILKDKSGDQQAMILKQQQLIDLQNRARQIIDEICAEHSEEFLKFLEIPGIYAENLQKLKSNVSIVKKKVKQTKALLLNTQKDIQQIHLNCLFNKKVYKQLKNIELRLQQYQTAYLALKNNQYYLCALNLPYSDGCSILESTLASRSETLRLRMMSKAIDELNNFLFFSPKVVLLTSNVMLDRMTNHNDKNTNMMTLISNWEQQQVFFKRYKLFKKAYCLDYLSKIWQFSDVDRRQGKLGLMYDIIKGIIRIGKLAQITSSIQIYGPKQISNTFLLMKCFRISEEEQQKKLNKEKTYRWFFDQCTFNKEDQQFISCVMNIIGVLFRKGIIIHKMYYEYQQKQFQFNSFVIYKHVLIELRKLIELLYFCDSKNEQQNIEENTEEQLNDQIWSKLAHPQNYINYGYSSYIIGESLKIIEKSVCQIEEKQFNNEAISKNILNKGDELLAGYQEQFFQSFHRDFMITMEQIFSRETQSFVLQSFETIISYKSFQPDEIKYTKGYRTQDKKSIKEYIFILSFMKSIEQFFQSNHLKTSRCYQYLLMVLLYFYLKLNNYILLNLVQPSEVLVIVEQRKVDKKMKKKQEEIKRTYEKILTQRQIKDDRPDRYNSKIESRSSISSGNTFNISYHTTDKLKVLLRQNQMLLSFSCLFFQFIQDEKNGESVEEFIRLINKLQPGNYDEQIKSKLSRVWDTLPESEKLLKQYLAAVLYKLLQIHLLIVAKLYRQTGSF